MGSSCAFVGFVVEEFGPQLGPYVRSSWASFGEDSSGPNLGRIIPRSGLCPTWAFNWSRFDL